MKKGFCDLVPPVQLPENRVREIESALAEASAAISKYQEACGSSSGVEFYVEFMRLYRRGKDIQMGSVLIPAQDADAMIRVKEVEPDLLSGFSRMIQKAILCCARQYGRDAEDLQAEAYEALFRAMVKYDGSASFCTYLWYSLVRNISRACLDRGELKVPRDVRKIAMRVVDTMHKDGLTFDEAVEAEGVSESYRKKVVSAMSKVCSATELEIDPAQMASTTNRESFGWVGKAVERAGLGPLETAVLKGFMEAPAGVMGLSEGCRGLINPDTGRPYSRAALSSAWKQARKKISRAIDEAA